MGKQKKKHKHKTVLCWLREMFHHETSFWHNILVGQMLQTIDKQISTIFWLEALGTKQRPQATEGPDKRCVSMLFLVGIRGSLGCCSIQLGGGRGGEGGERERGEWNTRPWYAEFFFLKVCFVKVSALLVQCWAVFKKKVPCHLGSVTGERP